MQKDLFINLFYYDLRFFVDAVVVDAHYLLDFSMF